ncbi:uncharacterized protein [Dysidea avara]|uniref:uncharacterized protein isoform X1 n=1 Tax=Dysidea avara TaxID=196820 RepID=UPI00332F5641
MYLMIFIFVTVSAKTCPPTMLFEKTKFSCYKENNVQVLDSRKGEKSPTRTFSESTEPQNPAMPDTYAVVDMTKKHNKSNYVELERFDDQRLTVMLVPVPEVTYLDVKIDLR